jgi:hypothetical protein
LLLTLHNMSDAYLNYDALKLPSHIETVLLTGAGGE